MNAYGTVIMIARMKTVVIVGDHARQEQQGRIVIIQPHLEGDFLPFPLISGDFAREMRFVSSWPFPLGRRHRTKESSNSGSRGSPLPGRKRGEGRKRHLTQATLVRDERDCVHFLFPAVDGGHVLVGHWRRDLDLPAEALAAKEAFLLALDDALGLVVVPVLELRMPVLSALEVVLGHLPPGPVPQAEGEPHVVAISEDPLPELQRENEG